MKLCAALILSCLVLSNCATLPNSLRTTGALHGDAAHPAQNEYWVRTELYFGVGLIGHHTHGTSETQARDLLDREVTLPFPWG